MNLAERILSAFTSDETGDTIDPDDIESNCHASPIDADGPTDVWCGADAVTFGVRPSGHRVYLCDDHARQVARFDGGVFDEDARPAIVDCKRCHKPTPRNKVNHERICDDCQLD